jgi:hypothetical protein
MTVASIVSAIGVVGCLELMPSVEITMAYHRMVSMRGISR